MLTVDLKPRKALIKKTVTAHVEQMAAAEAQASKPKKKAAAGSRYVSQQVSLLVLKDKKKKKKKKKFRNVLSLCSKKLFKIEYFDFLYVFLNYVLTLLYSKNEISLKIFFCFLFFFYFAAFFFHSFC